MKIHHIGYLVKDLTKSMKVFENLGYINIDNIVYDEFRKINICFMKKDGYTIELVSPVGDDSVVSNLLRRYNNSPYHICYESNSFEDDIKNLSNNGFVMIDGPLSAPAISNKRVVFLFGSSIGLIEIVEK